MDLKKRLDALRRQAGATPGVAVPGPEADRPADPAGVVSTESLAAEARADLRSRLRRLAGQAGPASRAGSAAGAAGAMPGSTPQVSGARYRGAPAPATALAERLSGQVVAEHLVLVESVVPLDTWHGRRRLVDALEPLWPLAAPSPPSPSQAGKGVRREPASRVLGIDTETTGLAGGTGTAAFMVGVAEAGPEGVRLRQWLLTAFAGEAAMLGEVAACLAEADLVVSYNGKTFDLPLLRDRRRLLRGSALPEPLHLDLLHPARRLFRRIWPDCRLTTAEQRLLGLYRRQDLPGSEAPRAWRDFLAGAPADDLERVLRHNAWDVLSLLMLGPALARVLRDRVGFGADPAGVAATWARCGDRVRALAVLENAREELDPRGKLALARALRGAGRWAEAAALWELLAHEGSPEALECLAKYHEHVRRDWPRALAYAQRLDQSPEARHRRGRLERRLAAGQGRLDL